MSVNFCIFLVISNWNFMFSRIDFLSAKLKRREFWARWVKASVKYDDCIRRSRLRVSMSSKESIAATSICNQSTKPKSRLMNLIFAFSSLSKKVFVVRWDLYIIEVCVWLSVQTRVIKMSYKNIFLCRTIGTKNYRTGLLLSANLMHTWTYVRYPRTHGWWLEAKEVNVCQRPYTQGATNKNHCLYQGSSI